MHSVAPGIGHRSPRSGHDVGNMWVRGGISPAEHDESLVYQSILQPLGNQPSAPVLAHL